MGMMNRLQYVDHVPGDRVKPQVHTGVGLTKQEFGNESDINVIIKRYSVTGHLPQFDHQPIFADVSNIGAFGDVLVRVHAAEDAFQSLPAKLRSRFFNRPENLVAFLQDSRNRDEAVKLGLISPPATPAVPPAGAPAVTVEASTVSKPA